jgi:hypothetical protein
VVKTVKPRGLSPRYFTWMIMMIGERVVNCSGVKWFERLEWSA